MHRKKCSTSRTGRLSARSPSTVPRGLGSWIDMIAVVFDPPGSCHRSILPMVPWKVSLNRASVEPRVKKIRPRISPGPDPIGTGYIRPYLQFFHCVTIIAAVNEWPLQLSVAGWSMQHHRASARRMGGAERYPSIASYGDDGFRRLNPSYLLNLYWSFAASVNAKIDRADNKTGSSDLPVGRFVDRAVESFFRIFRKIFLAT